MSALSSVIAGAENAISVVSLKQKSLVLCARTKEEQKQWIKVRSFGPRACLCIIYIYIYIYVFVCMLFICIAVFMYVCMHLCMYECTFENEKGFFDVICYLEVLVSR